MLDRKLIRELRRSRGLLLAITSIITVGVMMFVYMRATYRNLKTAQSNYYTEGRMADFWIDIKKAPLAEIERLNDLDGVTGLRSRIHFFATVDIPEVAEPLNGLVLSLPDHRKPVINDVRLVGGSYFTERRANEVIVNDTFARKRGIRPGQWIHLLLNNRRQELYVVGTAMSCEHVYLLAPGAFVPDPMRFGVFYLKRSYAEEVFDFDGAANQVVGRLASDVRERPDALLDRAERMLEPYGVLSKFSREDQPSNRFLSDEIRGLGVFATFMPVIFLAVAALVLNVLIARLIEQQRTVIGTLKAIGYSDMAVFGHYLKFGLAVGLLGGVVGCIGGYFMASWITEIYTQYFEFPDLRNRFYPGLYLTGIGISLLFAVAGSLHGARSAVRLKPAEAMRAKPPESGGSVWLERIRWFWKRLSFSWRMVLRLVIRHRLRTAVGMFAAAMGTGLLVCGFILAEAIVFLVDHQYEEILRSDIDLVFEDELSEQALAEARRLPGVDTAEPMLSVAGTFTSGPHEHKGAILGLMPTAQLTVPRDSTGRRIAVPDVGLIISRKLAEILQITVGDQLTFRPSKGLRRHHQIPIMRITDDYLGLSVYANIDYLSRLVGESRIVNAVQLKTNPAPAVKAALYRELKQLPAVQAVNERGNVIYNLEKNYIEIQNIFIVVLTLFAGVIFFGSILTASMIGLAERRREVATFQVLGYTEWQIGGLFLRESLLVNSLGTIAGLPLGLGLAHLIAFYYNTELFRFPVATTPWVWINTMLLSLLFALLAHAFVQRAVHRVDWVDALNVKE
jgi:putative ABC transport system permease protein